VNRLVKLKHITRRASADDRRQQVLSLAASGRALIQEALPRFVELEREMLSPLTPGEQDVLSDLLAKVVMAMFQNHPDDFIE
jgi:DNA-binding MarR family transcriptional regulator